jgi:hypothetical protein
LMGIVFREKGDEMSDDLKRLRKSLRHVKSFAKDLLLLRATLAPFEDVFISEQAGPQPQASDYDPTESPWFIIEVDDIYHSKGWVQLMFTAKRITMTTLYRETDEDGEEELWGDEAVEITLDGVFEFLRQLPRGAHSFTAQRRG